jgi:Na+:H+ antiporter, NhaA family
MKKIFKKNLLKSFFQSQMAVGLTLIFVTFCALIVSNSENFEIYQQFFNQNIDLNLEFFGFYKALTLRDWINDFLMAIFFFLIGLELKSEILIGELSSKKKMALPLICAIGGVIAPMLFFAYFNQNSPENMRGLAIPCATDIAFAYGFITLFGKTFSDSLKIFIVALAVIDDLIAILIIAIFYSQDIEIFYLGYACLAIVSLIILNSRNSSKIFLYILCGLMLWLMILKSGLHATLAGVILAMFIPLKIGKNNFLEKVAHKISPTVNFFILPIFAFANSGVRIEGFSLEKISSPIIVGVTFGLFFGKQIGVMLSAYLSLKFGLAKLPRGTNWIEFYGASLFTGIGFTMSLFIASLAFSNDLKNFDDAKIGVLLGSIFSVIAGGLVAWWIRRNRQAYSK